VASRVDDGIGGRRSHAVFLPRASPDADFFDCWKATRIHVVVLCNFVVALLCLVGSSVPHSSSLQEC